MPYHRLTRRIACAQPLERRLLLAAGDLDFSFNGTGVLTGPQGFGAAVAVDAGAGRFYTLAGINAANGQNLSIARVLPSGLLDGSFAGDGTVDIDLGGDEFAIDAAVAPDGKLLILGESLDAQFTLTSFLVRYLPNGQRDRNFGSNGFSYLPGNFFANAIAVSPSGDIFVAGGNGARGDSSAAVAKVVIDGVLDLNFGSAGIAVAGQVSSDEFNDVAVSGAGVLTIGGATSIASVQRYSANGVPDPSFGSGGATIISPFAQGGWGLGIQSDGGIIAMGASAGVAPGGEIALARLLPDGTTDGSFGAGGFLLTGIPIEFSISSRQLAVEANDRIIVGGDPVTGGALNGLTVNRYNPNGTPDLGFGVSGTTSFAASIGSFFTGGLALLPPAPDAPAGAPDIVVVGGTSAEPDGNVRIVVIQGDVAPPFAVLDARNGLLTVTGTPGADALLIDVQFGVTLVAQLGPDQLFFPAGGVQSISISTGDGPDDVTLGPGVSVPAVVLLGGGNNRFQHGGTGNVTVRGGGGRDTFFGGPGNDLLEGLGNADRIFGGGGNDIINTGSGGDFADGGDGNDSITGGEGADTLFGAAGADTLAGRDGDDLLNGGDGNDQISGEGGNDFIDGGAGADFIDAGEGDDAVIGGSGNDSLFGGPGRDELSGSAGNDVLEGGAGHDLLLGGTGNDILRGGAGSDSLDGQAGEDSLSGGDGNDLLLGTDGGRDVLAGDAGVDICRADPEDILRSVELRYRFRR